MFDFFQKLSKIGKIFLISAICHGIFLIVIEIVGVSTDTSDYTGFYSALFFLSVIFAAFFAFIVVTKKNIFQLGSFGIANLLLIFYSVYEFAHTRNTRLYFLFIVNCLFLFFYGYMIYQLYKEFNWEFWSKAGTTELMQRLYKFWQLFLNFVGLDLMVNITLLIGAMTFLFDKDDYEGYVDLIGVILTSLWCWLGYWAYKNETKKWTIVFLLLGCLEPIYLIIKLILFRVQRDTKSKYSKPPIYTIDVLIALALIVRIGLSTFTILGYKNFGQGLKDRLSKNYVPQTAPQTQKLVQDGNDEDEKTTDESTTDSSNQDV
ncbi:hypothetical protein M0811_04189 [Anaeramoeba ignava]|uniref:DUF7789 domain-containing protein n=1 Tax=Anaeramoeba ignava TaxID=1746090 RepID=A0A9Q0LWD8_ANAIG|nr:hypothetical protein M0811_04189 [Anaeramoeba ignava]